MTERLTISNWLPLDAIHNYKHLKTYFFDANGLTSDTVSIKYTSETTVTKQWRGKKQGGYVILSDNTMIYRNLLSNPEFCNDGLELFPITGQYYDERLEVCFPNHTLCKDKHVYYKGEQMEWETDEGDKYVELIEGGEYHELHFKNINWKSFIVKDISI
jgi:hypothetical protein